MYSEKFLENSIKLLKIPFPVMLHNFFTLRALKGQLGTQWALQGHSGTQALEVLGNSNDTWAFGH